MYTVLRCVRECREQLTQHAIRKGVMSSKVTAKREDAPLLSVATLKRVFRWLWKQLDAAAMWYFKTRWVQAIFFALSGVCTVAVSVIVNVTVSIAVSVRRQAVRHVGVLQFV
jgi:hypothetical protein